MVTLETENHLKSCKVFQNGNPGDYRLLTVHPQRGGHPLFGNLYLFSPLACFLRLWLLASSEIVVLPQPNAGGPLLCSRSAVRCSLSVPKTTKSVVRYFKMVTLDTENHLKSCKVFQNGHAGNRKPPKVL